MSKKFISTYCLLAPVIMTQLLMTGCQTIEPTNSTLSKSLASVADSYPILSSISPSTNLQLPNGKLIFIYLSGTGDTRQARLIETNVDGTQPKTLFTVNGTIMSLSSSQVDRRLIFTMQQGKSYPKVVILDRDTLKLKDVSAKRTNNFSGVFSPDGQQLLLANSQTGNPEIFLADSAGNIKQQLTHQPSIDVAPVWLPNSQSFVFTSDKSQFLHPQLYQYDVTTSQVVQLTTNGKSNAIARISPKGNLMTYVADDRLGMLMDVASKKTTPINDSGLSEPANFSPDGKFLIFSGQNRITIMPVPKLNLGKWQKDTQTFTLNFVSSDNQRFTIREPIWVKD